MDMNVFLGALPRQDGVYFKPNFELDTTVPVLTKRLANYGGLIKTIATDDKFIYVGGQVANKIFVYDKESFQKVGETPAIAVGSSIINVVKVDANNIYAGVANGALSKAYIFDKITYQLVGDTGTYGGNIASLDVDDSSIYVGGNTTNKVFKYDKITFQKVGESTTLMNINSLIVDGEVVYAVDNSTPAHTVAVLDKNTLTLIGRTSNYAGTINVIASDEYYIYVAGDTTAKILIHDKATLSLVHSIPIATSIPYLTIDEHYIYVSVSGKVNIISKDTFKTIGTIDDYGGTIYSIAVSDDYICIGGNTMFAPLVVRFGYKINGYRKVD